MERCQLQNGEKYLSDRSNFSALALFDVDLKLCGSSDASLKRVFES